MAEPSAAPKKKEETQAEETPQPSKFKSFMHSTWTLVVAIAVMGPFALPLAWKNPNYSFTTKILITIFVVALTVWLTYITVKMGSYTMETLQQMNAY